MLMGENPNTFVNEQKVNIKQNVASCAFYRRANMVWMHSSIYI